MAIKFDDSTYEFDTLAAKYGNFYAPGVEVSVEGTNIVREGVAVTNVSVTTTVTPEANHCTFRVANAYDWVSRDFKWLSQYFFLGKKVEVKMGYVDKMETVFIGLITSISFSYPEDGTPTLTVTCMDYSYLMMKGKGADSPNVWLKKKHSDVVKAIAGTYKLSAKEISDTSAERDTDRAGRDDFQLISDLARENHYEFFVLGQDLYFRKPYKKKSPVVTLVYGKNLRSFSPKIDIAAQVKQFVVIGRDDKYAQIVAKSGSVSVIGGNSKTGADLVKSVGDNKVHYVYTNITDKAALQEKADSLAMETAMKLVSGSGTSFGLPELIAGRFLKLDGLGARFNQLVYLTKVTHTVSPSGYTTEFDVRGNAV